MRDKFTSKRHTRMQSSVTNLLGILTKRFKSPCQQVEKEATELTEDPQNFQALKATPSPCNDSTNMHMHQSSKRKTTRTKNFDKQKSQKTCASTHRLVIQSSSLRFLIISFQKGENRAASTLLFATPFTWRGN